MDFSKYMVEAYMRSLSSPDPSTQNGAVLLGADGSMIGFGCNDFPDGVDRRHWHGEKADKYARVVHAEVTAILDAAINGNSTFNSTLVCPWAACSNCAKHIARAGVATLVRHHWEDQTTNDSWKIDCDLGDEIMTEAGVEIIEIPAIPVDFTIRRNGLAWQPR